MRKKISDTQLGVVGLGYVGLPLAVAFAHKLDVVGYDINPDRIAELERGHDRTREVSDQELQALTRLRLSSSPSDLAEANVYIVTTPTPIDEHKQPDMRHVLSASETVARVLSQGDVVIYESTVYPGATEEECVPLLEEFSGLTYNEDFFVGYSPERINPGDKEHRFESITKVTSGSTPAVAEFVDRLYAAVVTAGTHCAPSIRVAEAAKVIENTQRDINIALVNELALVFSKLGIDTHDVLAAAGTKWNFLPFKPGLVGGHCIGVDPYYLTHKAQAVGHHPELILAGRRLNDEMGKHVAGQLVRAMIGRGIDLRGARVLVLGLTFKENTPDLRNTKVVDVIRELETYGIAVDVHDPWADAREAKDEYDLAPVETPPEGHYDGIVLAVGHEQFRHGTDERLRRWGKPDNHVLYDLKGLLPKNQSDLRL